MSYRIRYQHTSTQSATSMRAALHSVRQTAHVSRLAHYAASDGLYLWCSRADMARDTDGSRAYAVIESPAQQESHS